MSAGDSLSGETLSEASLNEGSPGEDSGVPPHRALGLTDDEADRIAEILGRKPNRLELAMFAVMWSEHCSYKSSRLHLRRLPTAGQGVLVGPGENAGVIDAGDGVAVAFRIESHNHPCAIEPYQGAATGVGGILRDIFTMGARPIALMDSLRVGPLSDPRNRWILDGVVNGISGYGNSVGVPTVGGEIAFDQCFSSNPLVNVFCLGVMPASRLVRGRASGVGNVAVLLGASTGRDGIGGVSVLASAGLEAAGKGREATDKRPSVQVGDPFEEKRLIEACLELSARGLLAGLQDLGGAGITCAASETASRAGLGMDLNAAAVPLREAGMEPVEIMTSESQERMLAIVTPDDLESVMEVCKRWEVRTTVVGHVTGAVGGRGRLRVLAGWEGPVVADIPAASLTEDAPLYARPLLPPTDDRSPTRADDLSDGDPGDLEAPEDCGNDLLEMLYDPSWIYRQYDHQLFLNTVEGPGGDAAVLRLEAPGLARTGKGLAISTDGCSRWCRIDPRAGTAMIVAESVLNVACVGAQPLALVNCLNFGNPEHPEVMWQLSEAIDGMSEACRALDLPVVGGNVSLYNETEAADIDPTPVVAVVGLIEKLDRRPPGPSVVDGSRLVLLGCTEPNLGGSRWAVQLRDARGGVLPVLDLAMHEGLLNYLVEIVGAGLAEGVHDVSDGGLGVALAEMAVGSGTGIAASGIEGHAELFSESPSRAVVCTFGAERVVDAAQSRGIHAEVVGVGGGDRFVVEGLVDLPLNELTRRWRAALPAAVGPAEPKR